MTVVPERYVGKCGKDFGKSTLTLYRGRYGKCLFAMMHTRTSA